MTPSPPRFVPLRVHSIYSFGLGRSSPATLCRAAARRGFDAMALTDVHGTWGFLELHRAARREGIRPIYGTHVVLERGGHRPGGATLAVVLLALDAEGLSAVCRTASTAALARERDGRIDAGALGAPRGVVAVVGSWGDPALGLDARATLETLHDAFGDRLFVEVRGRADGGVVDTLGPIARELSIEPVLTSCVVAASVEGAGTAVSVPVPRAAHGAPPPGDGSVTSMPGAELVARWAERAPEAVATSAAIASLVAPDAFDPARARAVRRRVVVRRDPPGADDANEESAAEPARERDDEHAARVRREALAALARRVPESRRPAVERRVIAEIERMRGSGALAALRAFAGAVRQLEAAGVQTGPATGLRLQSMTAWLLGVTRIDPTRVDPWFEPVIGTDPGVFDVQVSPDERARAAAAVARSFAPGTVAWVPSLERLTPARALRAAAGEAAPPEIARAIELASAHSDATLRELVDENREFARWIRRYPKLREIVRRAARIEGIPVGVARSRRSLLVAERPLADRFGIVTRPDTGDRFAMIPRESLPAAGLLRVDFAPVTALAVLRRAPREIAGREPGAPWDAAMRALWESGDFRGIHLLEGDTAARVAHQWPAGPHSLIALVALMRIRGARATFPERARRYQRETGPFADDAYARDTVETYGTRGWLIFVEQLRDVIARCTGEDRAAAAAWLVRFASDDPGERAALRAAFMRAAAEQGVPMGEAQAWFVRALRLVRRLPSIQGVVADAWIAERMIAWRAADPDAFARAWREAAPTARRGAYARAAATGGETEDGGDSMESTAPSDDLEATAPVEAASTGSAVPAAEAAPATEPGARAPASAPEDAGGESPELAVRIPRSRRRDDAAPRIASARPGTEVRLSGSVEEAWRLRDDQGRWVTVATVRSGGTRVRVLASDGAGDTLRAAMRIGAAVEVVGVIARAGGSRVVQARRVEPVRGAAQGSDGDARAGPGPGG